jgi:hypothetical protein
MTLSQKFMPIRQLVTVQLAVICGSGRSNVTLMYRGHRCTGTNKYTVVTGR